MLWVSRHNREAVDAFLADLPGAGDRFTVVGSLDAVLVSEVRGAIDQRESLDKPLDLIQGTQGLTHGAQNV